MTRYTLHVPVEYTTRDGGSRTSYRRVGAVFENARRDTGETVLSIKLDFPVGATELVAFQPRPRDEEEPDGEPLTE